jgi:hypothetical protein
MLGLLIVLLGFVGCTTASTTTGGSAPLPKTVVAPQQTSPAGRYSGFVWTWDAQRNIVTFYNFDTGRIFRVQTTADQIGRLRMHENGSVTGQLLAPDEISVVAPR